MRFFKFFAQASVLRPASKLLYYHASCICNRIIKKATNIPTKLKQPTRKRSLSQGDCNTWIGTVLGCPPRRRRAPARNSRLPSSSQIGTQATSHTLCQGKGKGGRGKGKAAGKLSSMSKKAGLQFPTARLNRYMRKGKYAAR